MITLDWKMKFLAYLFRESQAEFFGKKGIPWHGVMFAYAGEDEDHHFNVEYIDQIMYAGKEDGHNTLQALVLAVNSFKASHADKDWCFVITDGGPCYSGSEFARGLATLHDLTGMQVRAHYLGEAGKNKTELDGHFAVAGSKLRRACVNGKGKLDIKHATSLFTTKSGAGEMDGVHTQLFEPSHAKVEFPGSSVIENLSKYALRRYVYDETGKFEALYLHQQSGLGLGLRIPRASVLGVHYDPSKLPTAMLIRESKSATQCTTRLTETGKVKKRKATEERRCESKKKKLNTCQR